MPAQDDPTRTAEPDTRSSDGGGSSPPQGASHIGRYLLEVEIGRGGMGVVYRARDPDLERQVAIKVVRGPSHKPWPLSRLLTEARAMAKLRHPNVLPIFDVGSTGDAVFLAMPLVSGGTLRDWLRAEPRPWRDVVQRFMEAGRGLAAAHAAGLVHRDFKPQNVLLDHDGNALVADFGLVAEGPDGLPGTSGTSFESSVMGTPAYMAPEQADGRRVDARADQYSFCVSFWEGLRGRRPAEDSTRAQGAVIDASPPPEEGPGQATECPCWLLDALAIGLAREPTRRWPSMTALLNEIERRLRPSSRADRNRGRRFLGGALVAATLAVPALVVLSGRESGSPPAAWVADAEASPTPRALTTMGACARRPVFADARMVVFEVPTTAGTTLYSVNVDSTGLRPLTDGTESIGWPARGRRDGEILALAYSGTAASAPFAAVFDLYSTTKSVVPTGSARATVAIDDNLFFVDDKAERLVPFPDTDTPSLPAFPPGSLGGVAFEIRTRAIAHVHRSGGPLCHRQAEASVSVCGERTFPPQTPAFSSEGDSVYLGDASGVWRIDLASGEESRIIEADASDGVTASPDGRFLLWASCKRSARITDVVARPETIVAEDDDVELVIAGAGNNLVWIHNAPQARELVVRGPTSWARVTWAVGEVREPRLDPTGSRIAFSLVGYTAGIHVQSADGSEDSFQVSWDEGDREPVWLDESTVLFHRVSSDGAYAVHMARTDHSGVTTVLREGLRVLAMNVPERTALVEIRDAASGGISWWNLDSDQLEPVSFAIPPDIKNASISSNGRWLMLQSGNYGQVLMRVSLPAGRPEVVHMEESGRVLGPATIRDDGHVLAAPRELKGELMMLDLVSRKPRGP